MRIGDIVQTYDKRMGVVVDKVSGTDLYAVRMGKNEDGLEEVEYLYENEIKECSLLERVLYWLTRRMSRWMK